ncbi:MAG: 50S ribosomal protein L6 [Planctomycetes bacterium]|nr:50S ribosomal protein L6 [Planctomycetota bacterium]
MSRLGNIPINVPDKVKVNLAGRTLHVEGPLGKLASTFRPEVKVRIEGGKRVAVESSGETKLIRALHGTTRSLIAGMLEGVIKGYEKTLDITGVGYNARVQGDKLVLTLGFSHPVELTVPKGLTVTCPSATSISVKGVDKHSVGEFAARIRRVRPAEPYNLKGIKYREEVVRRKAGKTFVTGAT